MTSTWKVEAPERSPCCGRPRAQVQKLHPRSARTHVTRSSYAEPIPSVRRASAGRPCQGFDSRPPLTRHDPQDNPIQGEHTAWVQRTFPFRNGRQTGKDMRKRYIMDDTKWIGWERSKVCRRDVLEQRVEGRTLDDERQAGASLTGYCDEMVEGSVCEPCSRNGGSRKSDGGRSDGGRRCQARQTQTMLSLCSGSGDKSRALGPAMGGPHMQRKPGRVASRRYRPPGVSVQTKRSKRASQALSEPGG